MRTSDVDILWCRLAQFRPEHWQSRWERNLKTAQRVEQDDWIDADKDKWVGRIIAGLQRHRGPRSSSRTAWA